MGEVSAQSEELDALDGKMFYNVQWCIAMNVSMCQWYCTV